MTIQERVPIEEVCEWIAQSMTDVFGTMFDLEVQACPPIAVPELFESGIAGAVGFAGEANGVVLVYVTNAFATILTKRMLGMEEAEITNEGIVNDVVGELSNMVAGGVKSRLCDWGSPCVLSVPSIVRGNNFKVRHTSTSTSRRLGFQCCNQPIVVELLTQPQPS